MLKHNGEYYAYGTAPPGDVSVPVLYSRDLMDWRRLGTALALRGEAFEALWAPEVAYDNGTFYMYSGGAWREPNYGVSYVVADHPKGPFAPEADAEGPGILRTSPGRVIGPGHASVALAPDNAHEYLVYHAWDPGHTSRRMRIDPLTWGERGPASLGPTLDPQPAPPLPLFRDNFDGPGGALPDPGSWRVDEGDWRQSEGELVQRDPGIPSATAQIVGIALGGGCLIEANVRLLAAGHERGRYGVYLDHGPKGRTLLTLAANGTGLLCERERDGQRSGRHSSPLALGSGFRSDAYHQLLLSVRGGEVEVRVDGTRVAPEIEAHPAVTSVGLITKGASAAFDGVSITRC